MNLIPLSEKWIYKEGDDSNRMRYYNPDADSLNIGTKAFHYVKVLTIRNDSLLSESDQFIGKESYMASYGKVQEYLIYTYNFTSNGDSVNCWTYFIERDPRKGERGYISKNEADSVLSSWGFDYPK